MNNSDTKNIDPIILTTNSTTNNTSVTSPLMQPCNLLNKHIMISYNQVSSGKLARKINDKLKLQGYKTWIDYEHMNGNINNAMAKAVDGSFLVLVLVTDEYCKSQNCINECEYADRQGKHLIPIKVKKDYSPSKSTGNVGIIIGGLLYVDFSECDFQDSFKNLIDQIEYVNNNDNTNKKVTKIITINKKKSIIFINNYFMNKRMWALLLIIVFLLVPISTVATVIAIKFRNKEKVNVKQNTAEKIIEDKSLFKYCLITPTNEYIYYNGNGEWCIDKDKNQNPVCYQQESKDKEGIVISSDTDRFRLTELNRTIKDPQPRWENAKWSKVWKKLSVPNEYIYPKSNDSLVELISSVVYRYHEIKYIKGQEYYFVKDGNWHFKINNTGMYFFGNSFNNSIEQFWPGRWA